MGSAARAADPGARGAGSGRVTPVASPGREAEAVVASALARAAGGHRLTAVFVVDVDGVADVEGALGPEAGERVLAQIADRLHDAVPPASAVVALASGGFTAVCEGVADTTAATRIADELIAAVGRPLPLEELSVRLVANVGIALAGEGRGVAHELLRDARGAARHARVVECGGWQLADPAVRERSLRRLRLADELGGALERDELTLHFQPMVSVRRGSLLGIEALLRWRHPTRGLVGAAHFVPVAEQSGLILEIGDWVMGEVCRQIGRWSEHNPDRPVPPIAVNVSARELHERTFATRLADTLGATQVSPQGIALEIAGVGFTGSTAHAFETLEALKRLGVRLVLDGFGGEGSSLTQLVRLPVDGIKLDPAFVGDLGSEPTSASLVEAVVDLGHALGLTVTAPGIETTQQLAAARALSVDAAQGHLIARPTPASSLLDLAELERELAEAGHADGAGGVPPAEELVALSTAAEALGVSPSTVRRLADQGVLPGTRTEGGHRRFRRTDVQRVARERTSTPILKPWQLPDEPLETAAMILDHEGAALVERTARGIYDPHRPGWFAEPQGRARGRQWIDALGAALGDGAGRDAIDATVAYLDTGVLAGATAAECSRFLGQFATIAMHELVRVRASADEVRALQRVLGAATEAFLERLAQ